MITFDIMKIDRLTNLATNVHFLNCKFVTNIYQTLFLIKKMYQNSIGLQNYTKKRMLQGLKLSEIQFAQGPNNTKRA